MDWFMEIHSMYLVSFIVFLVSMSLSQHLGDLTGKKLEMPWHTGKFVGGIFIAVLAVEHQIGLFL